MPTTTTSAEGLKRVIGVRSLAATVINNTIGAGIFPLIAIVGIAMGIAGITGYIFCGLMIVLIMLCYIEVASRVTGSGGSYAYVEAAFGPFAGFLISWLFFFGYGIMSDAAVINLLADSLSILFPVFANPFIRAVLFFVLLGSLAIINVRGAKQGVQFVIGITIIKLLPLFWLILFGLGQMHTANLHWEHFPSTKTLGETSLALFFAFSGFETSLNSSGEIKNPTRTIPKGLLLGIVIVLIIYLLLQVMTQGVLGPSMSLYKEAPLAAVAKNIIGPAGISIIIVAAIISCLGNVSGDVLATPRIIFAGARDGLYPKFLGKTHPRFATPYVAVIVYTSLIFIASVSGGFKQLAVLASASALIIYLSVILAMIKFRLKKEKPIEKTFRAPGGLIIPVIAIIFIAWMLSHLSNKEIFSMLYFLGACSILYFVMGRWQQKVLS